MGFDPYVARPFNVYAQETGSHLLHEPLVQNIGRPDIIIIIIIIIIIRGTRYRSGWGTMLQAGRSLDRVPMRWIFSNVPNPSAGVDSASNRNEHQES
jgi:hypothetical protein